MGGVFLFTRLSSGMILNMTNNFFDSNTAQFSGILSIYIFINPGIITLKNNIFFNTSASYSETYLKTDYSQGGIGGGLFMSETTIFSIENKFLNNWAASKGFFLFLYNI